MLVLTPECALGRRCLSMAPEHVFQFAFPRGSSDSRAFPIAKSSTSNPSRGSRRCLSRGKSSTTAGLPTRSSFSGQSYATHSHVRNAPGGSTDDALRLAEHNYASNNDNILRISCNDNVAARPRVACDMPAAVDAKATRTRRMPRSVTPFISATTSHCLYQPPRVSDWRGYAHNNRLHYGATRCSDTAARLESVACHRTTLQRLSLTEAASYMLAAGHIHYTRGESWGDAC